MMMYSCQKCGSVSGVRRDFCQSCRSDKMDLRETMEGTVLESVYLTATPEGNGNSYFVVLVESCGAKFLCRSDSEIPDGSPVRLEYRNEIPFAIRVPKTL